jgi:hypothetical protein
MLKARKPFVRVGEHVCWVVMAGRSATQLTRCAEQECKYHLPTYPQRQDSANIAGVSWIGEGEKKMYWDVLYWSAMERVGSGRNATEYHTSALSHYRFFPQGLLD